METVNGFVDEKPVGRVSAGGYGRVVKSTEARAARIGAWGT